MGERQVTQRVCAVMGCRKRTGLIRTKTFDFAHLLDVELCAEHHAEHDSALHEKFRDTFDNIDFVDPERQ